MKEWIAKLLPLDSLIMWAMKLGILRGLLKYAAEAYGRAQGVRSQSLLVLASLLAAAAWLGWLPWETAKPLIVSLVGAAAPALLDKIARLVPLLEESSQAAANEAQKQKEAQQKEAQQ